MHCNNSGHFSARYEGDTVILPQEVKEGIL